MKKLILTLVMLLTTLVSNAQIGVVTLDKGVDYVPMGMWYTIHEKDRKNQMYYTTKDEEATGEVLMKVLSDLGLTIDDSQGKDGEGDSYWGKDLDNGFYSWVFFSEEDGFYTVTIMTEEQ